MESALQAACKRVTNLPNLSEVAIGETISQPVRRIFGDGETFCLVIGYILMWKPATNTRMTNSNDKDEKFREGFLGSKDNEFHRQLSGLRNSDNIQNHPDAELLMLEQKRRMREEQIAQTLSGVFARQDLEKSREEYDAHRSSTFEQAPAAPVHRPHAATQIVQLNSGIYDDVASSVFSFQHAMDQMRREAKRARRFNRPYTVCIAAFHELKVINDKLGTAAYEKALDYIAGVLVQAFDLDIEIVGRYSSDRFVIVLPEVEGPATVHLMDSIRKTFVERPMTFKQFRFNLKASIGIVYFPEHGIEWRELIAKADLVADMLVGQGGNGVAQMPIA